MTKTDILLVLLMNLIWGCSFTFTGYAVIFYAPIFIYSIRGLLSGGLTVAFNKFPKKSFGRIIIISLLQSFLFAAMGNCIKNVDSSTAAILIRLDIIFTMILGCIFLNEKMNFQTIVGTIICFFAIYIMFSDISFSNLKYVIMMLFGAIASGVVNIIVKTISDVDNKSIVSWSSLLIGIELMILSLFIENPMILRQSTYKSIFAIIYLSIFASYVGYLILYFLLRKYTTEQIMPYNFTRPIFSMIFGFLILDENISLRKIIGVAMILFGIGISEFYSKIKSFFTNKIGQNYKINE